MNQKGFSPLFIILGIILAVGITSGAYYFGKSQSVKIQLQNTAITSNLVAQSSDPTSESDTIDNWKTYKNDVFGISFQYPSDYTKIDESFVKIMSPERKDLSFADTFTSKDFLEVSVGFSHDKYNSFDELKNKETELLKISGFSVTESRIGNIKAVRIINTEKSQQVPSERYEFLRNGYTFYILKYPHPTTRQADFDKIISTFKFYQPTKTVQSFSVNLDTAWQDGTLIYTHPNLGITFEYPKSLEIQTPNAENSLFYLIVTTPDVSQEKKQQPEFDFQVYGQNTMRISITEYLNSENLSLYDFIAKQNRTYPGDGKTETFDTYKKFLKQTNIPKDGSYVFEGIIGENPSKKVYFENNGKVYVFRLGGGNNTGEGYSNEANKLFENILKSIKFL